MVDDTIPVGPKVVPVPESKEAETGATVGAEPNVAVSVVGILAGTTDGGMASVDVPLGAAEAGTVGTTLSETETLFDG